MPTAPARLPRPVLSAILDALLAVFGREARAEMVVDEVLRHRPKWGARDRRLFAHSVYELVRWWRREAWRAGVDDTRAFGPGLDVPTCARIWSAWWQAQGQPIPDVSEWLQDDALPVGDARPLSGAPAAVAASLPDWLDAAGAAALGADWPAVREALNLPADVHLRVNTLRATPRDVMAALARESVAASPFGSADGHPHALRLSERRSLAASPAFRAGLFEIQDAGSQEIAPFLHPQSGETIVDACAGGGGKALHLAALMRNHGRILAFDIHPWKLQSLEKRALRAGARIVTTQPVPHPADLAGFRAVADRLLIDAPCSGLGVLRRHPDTKWKITPAEIDRLVRLQAELIDEFVCVLKPGGTLVYATCSFLPAENRHQILAFLDRQPSGTWSLEEERQILPHPATPESNHDAFYMARLRRRP